MSPREGVYYIGMIGGMVAGVSIARALGWHQLVGLACGLGLGWPLGYLCERMYVSLNSSNNSSRRISHCANPNCGWTGDPESGQTCPRCGGDLKG